MIDDDRPVTSFMTSREFAPSGYSGEVNDDSSGKPNGVPVKSERQSEHTSDSLSSAPHRDDVRQWRLLYTDVRA